MLNLLRTVFVRLLEFRCIVVQISLIVAIILTHSYLSSFAMNKTVKCILEIIKIVASALLGYYGGNAVM